MYLKCPCDIIHDFLSGLDKVLRQSHHHNCSKFFPSVKFLAFKLLEERGLMWLIVVEYLKVVVSALAISIPVHTMLTLLPCGRSAYSVSFLWCTSIIFTAMNWFVWFFNWLALCIVGCWDATKSKLSLAKGIRPF